MPRLGVLAPRGRTEDVIGEECAICFDRMNHDTPMRLLPCRHAYHVDCISHWLLTHNTCPECRVRIPLTPEDIQRRREEQERHENEMYNISPAGACLHSG